METLKGQSSISMGSLIKVIPTAIFMGVENNQMVEVYLGIPHDSRRA
jgi:hypothetical protein